MEARIKKIFHRKRDDTSEPSGIEDHDPEAGNTNSALRTSLYDLTIPRELPQTGTLPFQGNSTKLSPSHISSISASGPSPLSPHRPQHGSLETSKILSPRGDQQRPSGQVSQKGTARLPGRNDERQKKLPEIPVSALSPSLNVKNEVCQFLPGALDPVANSGEAMTNPMPNPMQANQSQANSKVTRHDICKSTPVGILILTFRTMKRQSQIGSKHLKR